jgi:hypothetical protein
MQDPDETPEQPDDFDEAFKDALQKIPPGDFERSMEENINELHDEAQIVPLIVEFPKEVIESLEAYEKTHSIDRDLMFGLAVKAHESRTGQLIEMMERFFEDPESFKWPIEDPLLCIMIRVMQKHAERWIEKVNLEYGDDQGDWWKGEE